MINDLHGLAKLGTDVFQVEKGLVWLARVGLTETPCILNFVKDDFIITLTGDVAVEELLSIAEQLVFE